VTLGLDLFELADVETEDVASLGLVQRRVVEGQVDTRLEGLVDGADSVGGQEEKTVVVLENSKENRDKRIALHVLLGSLGQEHICLIKQKNTIPEMCQAEDVLESMFNLVRSETEITTGDDKQRLAVLHGDSFCRSSLTDTRNTMQKDHQTSTLSLDQILARSLSCSICILALENFSLEVRHDQTANNILVVALNAEVLEDAGLTSYGLEKVKVDRQEATLAKSVCEHTLGK
jgi:hypothetical protein